MIRYFPVSYKKVKPLHYITGQYEPLLCDHCGKDLLEEMFKEDYKGLMAEVQPYEHESGKTFVKDVYVACKGNCDRILQKRAFEDGAHTPWIDLSDLVIPVEFLRFLFATMNRIRSGHDIFADEAYKKEISILVALAQKVLRFTTEEEHRRVGDLQQIP